MFERAGRATIQRKDYFSELDMLGDADFGTNIAKGFELTLAKLSTEANPDIARVLLMAGDTFSMDVGSTIGGLLGQGFAEAGKRLQGNREMDAAGLAAMLEAMNEAISTSGGAKLGDKTLLDALGPAARAAEASARRGGTFGETLREAASAAEDGSNGTVDMVARKGRGSYLGERSRGRADPGAAFIAYFLRSMNQGE
jgi:dihydroxyacetone kinase-like protein